MELKSWRRELHTFVGVKSNSDKCNCDKAEKFVVLVEIRSDSNSLAAFYQLFLQRSHQ